MIQYGNVAEGLHSTCEVAKQIWSGTVLVAEVTRM